MGYIEGHSRDQMLLLPASVDDYVTADNPARLIAAFVDELDLGKLGFGRALPKATGRPGYDPADLLKLYLYGYLNRVRSSRCLAAEAGRNLEVMWLLGGLRPDFRTIADFRRVNVAAFKPLFRSFVLLCRRLDLFGRELVAVDGTRLSSATRAGLANARLCSRGRSLERTTRSTAVSRSRLPIGRSSPSSMITADRRPPPILLIKMSI
jgi:transposase